MFNKERFKQLADQAIQAGNRLATQASASVQNAQHQIASRRAAQTDAGSAELTGGDGANLLGNNSGHGRLPQSEETILALQRQNEVLVRRLHEANRVLEENRQLKSKLEHLDSWSPKGTWKESAGTAPADSALLDQAAAKIEQLQQELQRIKNTEAAETQKPGMHPAASESDMQALHSSLHLMQQELLASQAHAAQLTSKLEAQQAQVPAEDTLQQLKFELDMRNGEVADLRQQLERVQHDSRHQASSAAKHESVSSEYVSPMAQSGSELAEWEAAVQVQQDAEASGMQFEAAEAQRMKCEAEVEAVRAELAEVRHQHAATEAELEKVRAAFSTLQTQQGATLEAFQAELAEVWGQRAQQEVELGVAHAALAEAQDREKQHLQELLHLRELGTQHGDHSGAELATLQQELEKAAARAAENEEIIRQLMGNQETSKLQPPADNMPGETAEDTPGAHSVAPEQVTALQATIAELETAVADSALQKAELAEQTKSLQARIAELEAGQVQVTHERSRLQQDHQEATTPAAVSKEGRAVLEEGLAQRLLQMECQLSSAARAASVAASPQGGGTPQATHHTDFPPATVSAQHATPGGASLAEALLLRMERSIYVAEESIDTLRADLGASQHDNERLQQEVDSLNSRLASLSHTGARLADAVHELPQGHPVRAHVERLAESLHSIAFPSPANPSTPTASQDVVSEFTTLERGEGEAEGSELPETASDVNGEGGAAQRGQQSVGAAHLDELREAELEVARLKEELAQGYEQVQHAKETMHQLKLLHTSEARELRETLEARDRALAAQQAQHEADHAELTAQFAQQAQRIEELQRQLGCQEGMEAELAAHAARAEELQQQLQVAEADLGATSALVAELRVQLEGASQAESEALAFFKQELASSRGQVAELQQAAATAAGGETEGQRKQEEEVAAELAAVSVELDRLRPEAEELAQRLSGAQQEVAKSRDQMFEMQVQLEELADLRASCHQLAADKDRAEAELAGAKAHAETAQSEVAQLQCEVTELAAARDGAEAAHSELAAMQERLVLAEAARGDAEQRVRALEEAAQQQPPVDHQQLSDMQRQLEAAQGGEAAARGQLVEAQAQLTAAEQQCQAVEGQLSDVQQQLRSVQDRNAATEQQLGSLDRELAELRGARDAAQQQATQLNAHLGEVEGLVATLQTQLAASEQQQAEQAQRLEEAQQAGAKLQRQLVGLQQEAAGMQPLAAEVAALRPALAAAEAQVASVRSQLDAAEQELGSLRPAAAQLASARMEAESARSELDELRRLAEVELPAVRAELEGSRTGEVSAREEAAALAQRAAEAERQCGVLQQAEESRRRDEHRQQEEGAAQLAASKAAWEAEQAALQKQLQGAQSEVEKLLAQVNKAKVVLANSKKAAAAAEAAAAAAAQRAEAAEGERAAALEAAEASKNAEDELDARLEELERKAAEAHAAFEEEQRRAEGAVRAVHEELERLQPEDDAAARAHWLPAVRRLVERAEALAAGRALADAQATYDEDAARLEAECAKLRAASEEAAAAATAAEAEAAQAQQRVQQAEHALEVAAAAHAERVDTLEAQLAAARAELEEGSRSSRAGNAEELEERCHALEAELEEVRGLLLEKEEQIQLLKAQLPQAGSRPLSPSSLSPLGDSPDAPLLSPGGTTLRFLAPLSYADVAPPQQLPIPPANAAAAGRAVRPLVPPPPSSLLPLSTGPLPPRHRPSGSISSEIEPLGDGAHLLESRSERASSLFASQMLPPDYHPSLETVGMDESAALRARLASLENEVADSERTHALRDTATAVLKEEIADLRRQMKRGDVDLDYLKNVVIGGFESGELPASSHMLPVLARLLQFSPAEMHRIKSREVAAATSATSSSLFKFPGF